MKKLNIKKENIQFFYILLKIKNTFYFNFLEKSINYFILFPDHS